MQDSDKNVVQKPIATQPRSLRHTSLLTIVAAFALLLSTTNCHKATTRTDLQVSYTHTAYLHDNAFSGQLVLTNPTNTPVKDWSLAVAIDATIDSLNNGSLQKTDSTYTFTPTTANAIIAPHDSVVLQLSGVIGKHFLLPRTATVQNQTIAIVAHSTRAPKGSLAPRKVALLKYPDSYHPTADIRLGQGRIYPIWEQSSDAIIPRNRKTWAMAMAHAHKLFSNVTQTRSVPLSFYFATTLKETFCGCDPSIEVSKEKYPLVYQAKAQKQGCFQMELGTAWQELKIMYPDRFPADQYERIIANENFETAALAKAHYDIFTVKYLEIAKGYDPREFFETAQDSTAAMKVISLAYHQGLWSPLLDNIFVKNRTKALASPDVSSEMGNDWRVNYNVKSLANFATLLNGQPKKLDKKLTAINPQTGMPANIFYGFYDEPIAWTDIELYIQKISPMYRGQNWGIIKARLHKTYDNLNNGEPISFRYQFGTVLDQLILSLPASDPSRNIVAKYGGKIQYAQAGGSGRAAAKK
jgi:hypothetical protein